MFRAPPKHPNAFEHEQSLVKFVTLVVFFGILGTAVGRVIDLSVSKIQGDDHTKLELFLFFVLQMSLNALVIFVGFKTIVLRKLTLDDWISSTFEGVLFVTMCFSVQDNFYANSRGIL